MSIKLQPILQIEYLALRSQLSEPLHQNVNVFVDAVLHGYEVGHGVEIGNHSPVCRMSLWMSVGEDVLVGVGLRAPPCLVPARLGKVGAQAIYLLDGFRTVDGILVWRYPDDRTMLPVEGNVYRMEIAGVDSTKVPKL